MTAMLALTVVLAAGIGVSLGLLGGGGSILAVPLLVYVAGLPAKEAIATSLLVVGTTSAVGVLPHARAGAFGWFTFTMGLFVLARQLPANPLLWTVVGLVVAGTIVFAGARGRTRRNSAVDESRDRIPHQTGQAAGVR